MVLNFTVQFDELKKLPANELTKGNKKLFAFGCKKHHLKVVLAVIGTRDVSTVI